MEAYRRNQLFIIGLAALLAVAIVCGLFVYRRHMLAQDGKFVLTAYDSPENQRLLEADPIRKVLLFSFDYAADSKQPFKLKSIGQYNSRPQKVNTSAGEYSFSVVEDGNPAYTTNFSVGSVIVEEFHDDGTVERAGEIPESSYGLAIPRFKDGSTYILRKADGTIVLEGKINNVAVHDNEPEYKSFIAD